MEEVESERDFHIRKRVKEVFNVTEETFPSLKNIKGFAEFFAEFKAYKDFQYQDYEEFVEDLIYSLVKGINVEKTNQTIVNYKKKFLATISNNQSTHDSRIEMEQKQIQEEMEQQKKSQQEYHVRIYRYMHPRLRVIFQIILYYRRN